MTMTSKQSEWKPEGKPPCGTCKGTGTTGKNEDGVITCCPDCLGWGYLT